MRLKLLLLLGVTAYLSGFSMVGLLRGRGEPPAAAATATATAATMSLPPPDPRLVYKVLLDDAPARGAADPLVTAVIFGRYDCAGCRDIETSLSRLAAEDPKRLRVVWRDLPASAEQRLAARAARAAGAQERFWDMHDWLMASAQPIDEARVKQGAAALGLELPRFAVALSDPASERAIAADEARARDLGIGDAPALFINGRYVPMADLARLREQIDEASAFATQLVASGTPRSKLYAALMRGALARSGPVTALSFE